MSLGRLLTAGRSLVGGHNSGVQYRMTSPKAMPKFGSAKNPFRSTASPETITDEAPQPGPVVQPVAREQEPVKPVASPAPATVGQALKAPSRVSRWSAKLWGWLSRRRPKLASSAVPKFQKLPVQTELSLDRIKVLRNDLSDADLEIVTAKPAPVSRPQLEAKPEPQPARSVAGAAPVLQTIERAGAARSAWNRASRLFTATKT
jgi:hypothetical protein